MVSSTKEDGDHVLKIFPGSYAGAGYLISNLNTTGAVTEYGRYLDLDQAIARTVWTQGGVVYQRYVVSHPLVKFNLRLYPRTLFCSHPTYTCTQHIMSTTSSTALPSVSYAYSSALEDGLPTPNVTCLGPGTLQVRGLVGSASMVYEFLMEATAPDGTVKCIQFPVPPGSPPNATIEVTSAKEAWLSWVGGTNFDQDAGNEASSYTFQGTDPHETLLSFLNAPSLSFASFVDILAGHVKDYQGIIAKFALDLGQKVQLDTSTDELMKRYQIDATGNLVGNVYIEWLLLFNFGRYLLASSLRGGLPANLQGKWANGLGNAWSAGMSCGRPPNHERLTNVSFIIMVP